MGPIRADLTTSGYLLELVRTGRALTRGELQELTGLSRSTLGQRLDGLLKNGWLVEAGSTASTGGRPPVVLRFDEQHACVLTADLDTRHARAALMDLGGAVLAEQSGDLVIADGPGVVLDTLADWFDALLAAAGRSAAELAGIGVSVPGPVEFDTGLVIRPPIMPGWDEYPIRDHLRRRFDVPVLVDNDANAMALGEQTAEYPDCPAFVLVKVSTGIGSGVVIDGQVFRGIDGGAGDIGHIRVRDAGDAKCQCGSIGCLAAVASGGAIAAALTELGVAARSGADVRALLQAGQPDALRLAREAGRRVGEVLATVVSVLNPGVLMIAGDLAHTDFVAGVNEVLYQVTLPRATRHLGVTTGRLADRAALDGMARLVVNEVFSSTAVDARLATLQR
ncbi:putative NBD/HSP70 family sugar kinase [Kribbella pratensis]|uniref:NBD/HSP70 family sugar kinase n=1 Tax=Kribbella pratensis TaxID=2512112 RepID=A0ABY2F554_9ACTN|nr:ROK family protein [Kribbella pratensis]TDW81624.1 putative NBD/HSP70 family sugar kinase [Kribbella pratensis]